MLETSVVCSVLLMRGQNLGTVGFGKPQCHSGSFDEFYSRLLEICIGLEKTRQMKEVRFSFDIQIMHYNDFDEKVKFVKTTTL